MRVLHVSSGNRFGGVESVLLTLARLRALCPEMEPHFALSFEGKLSSALGEAGVPVYILGEVRASRPWTVLGARVRLRSILKRVHFDAAVCHMAWPQAIFGGTVRDCGVPLLFHVHGRMGGTHWTERWAARTVPDRVIAVSEYAAAAVSTVYPSAVVSVLYSPLPAESLGVSHQDRSEFRKQLGVTSSTPVIIHVSRMEEGKGHASMIAALAKLKDLPWSCWIVGGAHTQEEAAYVTDLRAYVNTKGLADRTLFMGERTDVPRLLRAADVFCHPNTVEEGFGMVFVEAFLAGLPVVTTAIGGGTEVVNDSCGCLVPAADVSVLADAVAALLTDADLRRRKGEAGRNRVLELCDPRVQMNKLMCICADTAQMAARLQ